MRDIVLGKPVEPAQAHAGYAWTHLSKDILAVTRLLLRGDLTVGIYARSLCQNLTFAAFAWDDPLPGILELPLVLYRAICGALLRKEEAR
jgi:predicted ATP-grasp superfamily ATP-dependent carboligase